MPGIVRSLPMQVSTMILRSPAVIPNAWIDSTRLPSSSTKCGRSHDACDAITSFDELGNNPVAGMLATLSTTRVMVTSPICHCRFSVTKVPPAQWMVRPSSSIVTNCSMRRARVSGRLASWMRNKIA